MSSAHNGSPSRRRRLLPAAAGLALLGLLPATGCQVEYAGMTLPSGKYMHDDVQYFESGPDFPYANTQAATNRARMAAAGLTPPPEAGAAPAMSPNAVGNPNNVLTPAAGAPPANAVPEGAPGAAPLPVTPPPPPAGAVPAPTPPAPM